MVGGVIVDLGLYQQGKYQFISFFSGNFFENMCPLTLTPSNTYSPFLGIDMCMLDIII